MIQVDEVRLARAPHVGDRRLWRDVRERAVAAVAEQVAPAFGTDGEQVEPAVVVEVGEGGERGALREGETRSLGRVLRHASLHAIQSHVRLARRPRRDEEVVPAVAVDVARSEGRGCVGLRRWSGRTGAGARAGEARVERRVDELRDVHRGALARPDGRDEVPRREREDGTSGDRTFGPPHILERGLIRCRDLHEPDEVIERGPRLRDVAGAQQLDRTVQIRARLSRRPGRDAPHLLELLHDAVRGTAPRERVDELEPHGEVRGRDREHVAQPLLVPAGRCGVALLRLELGQRIQYVRVGGVLAAKLLEQCARVVRTSGQRVQLREHQPDLDAPRIQLAGALQLLLRLGKAAALQVGEAQVGVAEWVVGRELGELLELRLGFRELVAPKKAECGGARGVELLHRRRRLFLARDAEGDGRHAEVDGPGPPDVRGRARQCRSRCRAHAPNI